MITKRMTMAPVLLATALGLSACASNYAGEGAVAGGAVGAGVGLLRGGDVAESAAIGAAAGAVGGALIEKDGRCYRVDRYGDEHRVPCD